MLLDIKNLTICTKRNKQIILEGSSFSLTQGGAMGIIGESGSGKTMTGKAIMGLLNQNVFDIGGSISYCGQELNGLPGKNRRTFRGTEIAMIMQNPMTSFAPMIRIGKQMIDTLAVYQKKPKAKLLEASIEAMEAFNLPNAELLMRCYPGELSGGMLQRIMIALTMLLKPKLIIADEATTAVDAISEQLILTEFERIRKAGVSFIVITHDFGVAASLCDSVIVMQNGRIIESGNMQTVFGQPKHDYTRELFNASLLSGGVPCYKR